MVHFASTDLSYTQDNSFPNAGGIGGSSPAIQRQLSYPQYSSKGPLHGSNSQVKSFTFPNQFGCLPQVIDDCFKSALKLTLLIRSYTGALLYCYFLADVLMHV